VNRLINRATEPLLAAVIALVAVGVIGVLMLLVEPPIMGGLP
jgi:hypothetical protein